MAVPKKRKSKEKSRISKAIWKYKASISAKKSLSLAKSILTGKSTSFVYLNNDFIDDFSDNE
uniref:Large ribosomal subunit protein bL32c n=1 Tax=Wrangelia sp. TaxID=2575620 RepID=A0A4D6X067_9FLOR|nr:ribosomal protein L32 [Wrangelia sp.]